MNLEGNLVLKTSPMPPYVQSAQRTSDLFGVILASSDDLSRSWQQFLTRKSQADRNRVRGGRRLLYRCRCRAPAIWVTEQFNGVAVSGSKSRNHTLSEPTRCATRQPQTAELTAFLGLSTLMSEKSTWPTRTGRKPVSSCRNEAVDGSNSVWRTARTRRCCTMGVMIH